MIKGIKKYFSSRSLPQLAAILFTVVCGGIVLAALLASDDRWVGWSFSRLGEAGAPSSYPFNLSLLLAAGLVWRISTLLAQDFKQLKVFSAAKMTSYSFKALAICLAGVALFPNDTQHAMHLFFSRCLVVVFVLYAIALPHSIPYLSKRGKIISYGAPILAIILSLQGFFYKDISFVLFEVLLGALALGWIYVLCQLVSKRTGTVAEGISISQKDITN